MRLNDVISKEDFGKLKFVSIGESYRWYNVVEEGWDKYVALDETHRVRVIQYVRRKEEENK